MQSLILLIPFWLTLALVVVVIGAAVGGGVGGALAGDSGSVSKDRGGTAVAQSTTRYARMAALYADLTLADGAA